MKKAKFVASAFLSLALLMGSVPAAFADAETTTNTANLEGGAFLVKPQPVSFPAVTITSENVAPVVERAVNNIVVDDRGTGEGWVLGVSATPLVSREVTDWTTGEGTFRVSIPAETLSVAVWGAYRSGDAGMEAHPVYGPISLLSGVQTLSEEGLSLIKADKGFGLGTYFTDLNFQFRAPKKGTVSWVSEEGSKLEVGSDIGLVATEYETTFTYTLSSGL